MASNIEIQGEDDDEEDDDDINDANVETITTAQQTPPRKVRSGKRCYSTSQKKHPRKTRSVRRRNRMVLGLGLLCGVQALLNIGLRLSLYSEWTEEKNNLVKDLDHLQSKYNNLTKDLDHLQSKYNNLTKDLEHQLSRYDDLTKYNDDLQSRYDDLAIQKDQIQSSYDLVTAERDELKSKWLCESSGWKVSGRGCYYISTVEKNWADSRQWCRDRQSELIIINSKEEQDFVIRAVDLAWEVWLGLTDREKEGVWKWVDGTPLTSPTYWSPAEPNNAGREGEDCASNRKGFTWFDKPCSLTRNWICEKAL